jgi:hypothetical protein
MGWGLMGDSSRIGFSSRSLSVSHPKMSKIAPGPPIAHGSGILTNGEETPNWDQGGHGERQQGSCEYLHDSIDRGVLVASTFVLIVRIDNPDLLLNQGRESQWLLRTLGSDRRQKMEETAIIPHHP